MYKYFELKGKVLYIGQEVLIKYNGQINKVRVYEYYFTSTSADIIYYDWDCWKFVDDLPENSLNNFLNDEPITLRLK